MIVEPFSLNEHNAHYVGGYSERAMQWRRLGAISKVDNMSALLKGRDVKAVLDVGCGTGAVLGEVLKRSIGLSHVGVDVADPGEHLDDQVSSCTFMRYNGETLPFDDHSFDLVYASHVVEHVQHPRFFMTELNRVAKSFIYIEVPCEIHIRTNHRSLQTSLDIGHINAYSPESFMIFLQSCGLDVCEFELFDLTRDIHCFNTSRLSGTLKMGFRRLAIALNPVMASRIFTLHCGALIKCHK